jgi:hypothetical protein
MAIKDLDWGFREIFNKLKKNHLFEYFNWIKGTCERKVKNN